MWSTQVGEWMISIIIVGFFVGTLVGLTGMGGGLLMTPLLILLYGFSPSMAIGTDLMYAGITKWVGGFQHLRQKSVDLSLVKILAIGSIPGSLIGAFSITFLHKYTSIHIEQFLGHLLGFTFIGVALLMIYNIIIKKMHLNKENEHQHRAGKIQTVRLILLGFAGGLLVGLTSVGSGSIFIAALMIFYPLAPARLVGSDIFHGAVLTTVAGLAHLTMGTVDLPFVLQLLIGSIPGIIIGSKLTIRIPESIVRLIILSVLLLTGIKLI